MKHGERERAGRFFHAVVLTALIQIFATGACALHDFRYINKDLGFATLRSPRIGIVALVGSKAVPGADCETIMSGFWPMLSNRLEEMGYEPSLVFSKVLPDTFQGTDKTREIFGDAVFASAKEKDLAAVWVFRVSAGMGRPGETIDNEVYKGDVPVLWAGLWLDSYSPDGALAGSRATSRAGWQHISDTKSYRIMPPDEFGAFCAREFVQMYIKPYHGGA